MRIAEFHNADQRLQRRSTAATAAAVERRHPVGHQPPSTGSALEFIRNSAVDARNYYRSAGRPTPRHSSAQPVRRHALGGPIKRGQGLFLLQLRGAPVESKGDYGGR